MAGNGMSRLYNLPHPGAVLIVNGSVGISADMTLHLAQWQSTSPDMWLGLQTQYDLWQADKHKRPAIEPVRKAV